MKGLKPAKQMATVWITRWALTKGIQKQEVELSNSGTLGRFRPVGYFSDVYVHGNDFYLTEEAARTRANEMVAKKIISTEKTLAKLKKLAF